MINLLIKLSGMGWIWDRLDGSKTYIAAAIGILTGLTGLLQEVEPLLAAHNAAGILDFLKGLPQDQSWLALAAGLGILGLGHKIEKASNNEPVTPQQQANT